MKTLTRTLIAALTICALNPALAEISKQGPASEPATRGLTAESLPHIAEAKKAWIKPRQLRCWQDGELIVEENDWTPDMKTIATEAVNFRKDPTSELYIFTLRDTFCMYRGGRSS